MGFNFWFTSISKLSISVTTGFISFIKMSRQKNYVWRERSVWEMILLGLCMENQVVPKIEMFHNFDLSRFSKINFSGIKSLISSNKVSIEYFIFVVQNAIDISFFWVPVFRILIFPRFRNELSVLIYPELQFLFSLRNYQQSFSLQSLHEHNYSRKGLLVLRTIDFVPRLEVLIVQNSQYFVINFDVFPIFQVIVLHNSGRDFLVESFSLKLFLFGKFFSSGFIDTAPCVGVLIVRGC